MSAFGISLYTPSGDPVLVPQTLAVQPQAWSAEALGGPWDADVLIRGGVAELAGLTAWLGYRLEILNSNGTAVWWGDIAAVEITSSGTRRGISLGRMANRVQVRYAQKQAGGGAASADTAWADDALSQAAYGVWERRISPARAMTATEAEGYRATALAVLAEPYYTLAIDAGEEAAHLYCTGYCQRLKRTYYSNLSGMVAHVANGDPLPLGLGFTSGDVAFVARTDEVHSLAGWLGNFQAGQRVKISGANVAGNNGQWVLDEGGDERTAAAYTSTAVDFSPNDDIADANGGLGFLAQNDVFTISGTNLNNGSWLLDKEGAAAIEVSGSYHGSLVTSESPGDTVVFTRGNKAKVTGSLANEHSGASAAVTVTAWGQKYYQTFTLPASGAWTAAAVEVRLRRVGGPTDSITVQLVANNAGVPGTVLDSATLAADDIPLEMGWVSFALSNTDTLTYGTTYGLVVLRTGANHHADYYEIDTDAGAGYAGGSIRLYDGAAWQTPDPLIDLVFRVLGARDTGRQAGDVLRSISVAVDAVDSGIVGNQYRDGETRADTELAALLATGANGGFRLLYSVLRNQAAVVTQRPSRPGTQPRWILDGAILRDLHGQPAEEGYLPAGEWLGLADAANLGPWARLSPLFAERAEYRADSGLTVEPEGQADQYDMGTVQG